MTKESIIALIRAAKKEVMTEEQVADIILDSFKPTISPAVIYPTKPIYYDTWQIHNTCYKNSTDNGDMI